MKKIKDSTLTQNQNPKSSANSSSGVPLTFEELDLPSVIYKRRNDITMHEKYF